MSWATCILKTCRSWLAKPNLLLLQNVSRIYSEHVAAISDGNLPSEISVLWSLSPITSYWGSSSGGGLSRDPPFGSLPACWDEHGLHLHLGLPLHLLHHVPDQSDGGDGTHLFWIQIQPLCRLSGPSIDCGKMYGTPPCLEQPDQGQVEQGQEGTEGGHDGDPGTHHDSQQEDRSRPVSSKTRRDHLYFF